MASALERSKALFIRRWGEMGGYWGISRTMAELHALMYTSAEPLCTDDIMEQLQISRGNTSMSLRQLVDWGLVARAHRRGDRKAYFACETDVWEMFQCIATERKRREVQPIVETIRRCREMVEQELENLGPEETETAQVYLRRLDAMQSFLNAILELLTLTLRGGGDGLSMLAALLTQLNEPPTAK
ncbi:MAG: ArsR family transcriptional regulator [Phycisphaerae bacterium]|nr:ArsR family transcriptional regulator [Phycisphaerae bacterium]